MHKTTKFISLKQYNQFVKKRKMSVMIKGHLLVLRIKDKDFAIAKKIDKLKEKIKELRREVE